MNPSRLFLLLYGVIFLLCMIALVRQLISEHWKAGARRRTLRGSLEGWFLFAAVIVLVVRYVIAFVVGHMMPKIQSTWLLGYGICCVVYLAAKAIHMTRAARNEEASRG